MVGIPMQLCIQLYSCTVPPLAVAITTTLVRRGGPRGRPWGSSTRRKRLHPVHHTSHTRPATRPTAPTSRRIDWRMAFQNGQQGARRSQEPGHRVRCSCRPFAYSVLRTHKAPTPRCLPNLTDGWQVFPMASRGPQSPPPSRLAVAPPSHRHKRAPQKQ